MRFICPKCSRYGMEWDGRAKVLVCYYNTCNHVIRMARQTTIPPETTILRAIKDDEVHIRTLVR